jgi:hypothetical protein
LAATHRCHALQGAVLRAACSLRSGEPHGIGTSGTHSADRNSAAIRSTHGTASTDSIPLPAAIVLGLVWAVFHFAADLQCGHDLGWIAWHRSGAVALRVLIAWVYNNTGQSVL